MHSITPPKGFFYFFVGMLLMLATLMLTGAVATPAPSVGRYRMTIITRNNFTDIFVIDTATGVIKYVGKDEGKSFDQIKGK